MKRLRITKPWIDILGSSKTYYTLGKAHTAERNPFIRKERERMEMF